jgi:DNA primase small subunit
VNNLSKKDMIVQGFLTQMFKKFYFSNFNNEACPSDIGQREFGFFYWDLNKFVRHIGFREFNELLNHIQKKVPKHIYCSAARYETPNAPNMKLKTYIDCELIFDLDIDHIPTPCKKNHDKWVCKACGTAGAGMAPKSCPGKNCTSSSFHELALECDECMRIAKDQIISIIEEFLLEDFGLNAKKDLFVVFSGQRGYHIHIEKESFRQLDANGRREIVDYITGRGLVPSYHGLNPAADKKPNIQARGWRGRIARLVLQFLEECSFDELQKILAGKVDPQLAKEEIISQLRSENPDWSFTRIGDKTWQRLIFSAINKFSGKIDEPVSIDLHRLIRLPGSLHGKTGFLVKKLKFSELEEFDPFKDAQVFEGTQKIYIKNIPSFRIGEETFGPLKDKYATLPMSAALYLLCKGLATL